MSFKTSYRLVGNRCHYSTGTNTVLKVHKNTDSDDFIRPRQMYLLFVVIAHMAKKEADKIRLLFCYLKYVCQALSYKSISSFKNKTPLPETTSLIFERYIQFPIFFFILMYILFQNEFNFFICRPAMTVGNKFNFIEQFL